MIVSIFCKYTKVFQYSVYGGKKVESSDKLSEIKPNKTLKERWKVANSDAKGLVQASAGHDCC